MSGHSQFKNIMYRKDAQDAKRARAFAKIGREIFVAAKQGGQDPNSNPRLRSALINARSVNMPNDNINRILKKASGNDASESYEEVRYEGFGVGGVSVIVEALTDNRNRTASEIRSTFTKYGGNFGEIGSVSFMFEKIGRIIFLKKIVNFDALFEAAVEVGASDVKEEDEFFVVSCSVDTFGQTKDMLIQKFGDPLKTEIIWQSQNMIDCDFETLKTVLKMIDVLEENEDVQNVYSNWTCSNEIQEQINKEFC
jgi:YebC/PmpR family DNA-binding regulatory protein